jgi:hypothetical protein
MLSTLRFIFGKIKICSYIPSNVPRCMIQVDYFHEVPVTLHPQLQRQHHQTAQTDYT